MRLFQASVEASDTNEVSIKGFLYQPYAPWRLLAEIGDYFHGKSQSQELTIFLHGDLDLRLIINQSGVTLQHKFRAAESPNRAKKPSRFVTVPLSQAESFVRLLNGIGHTSGKFSWCNRLDFYDDYGAELSLRTDSATGDFWVLRSDVAEHGDPDAVKARLDDLALKLRLEAWDRARYDEHTRNAFANKQIENLILDNGALHPEIERLCKLYALHAIEPNSLQPSSIQYALGALNNDYSGAETFYRLATGLNLVDFNPLPKSSSFTNSCSIVIPFHRSYSTLGYALEAILNQGLSEKEFKNVEVIIVDDGSQNPLIMDKLRPYFDRMKSKGIQANLVQSSTNLGRSSARNLGMRSAKNDVLVFLDSDICIAPNYIRETMVRHQYVDDIVLVGFKENVIIDDQRVREGLHKSPPNIKNDWRFTKTPEKDWSGIWPVEEEREVHCLDESDNFKRFGGNFRLPPWDWPCMVVSHNMSVRTRHALSVGGFDPSFAGLWGFEDTFFGACLISIGCRVVPLLSTGVHHLELNGERNDGTREEKLRQMEESKQIYVRLIGGNVRNDYRRT